MSFDLNRAASTRARPAVCGLPRRLPVASAESFSAAIAHLHSTLVRLPPTLLRAFSIADCAGRLLQRGANPNLKDQFKAGPLQYAVQPLRQFDGYNGEASPIMVDMAKLLMEYGR